MTEEGRTQQILITSDFSIKYTPKETLSESFHFTTEIVFAGESKEKINLKKKKKESTVLFGVNTVIMTTNIRIALIMCQMLSPLYIY